MHIIHDTQIIHMGNFSSNDRCSAVVRSSKAVVFDLSMLIFQSWHVSSQKPSKPDVGCYSYPCWRDRPFLCFLFSPLSSRLACTPRRPTYNLDITLLASPPTYLLVHYITYITTNVFFYRKRTFLFHMSPLFAPGATLIFWARIRKAQHWRSTVPTLLIWNKLLISVCAVHVFGNNQARIPTSALCGHY